jgi:hypothetical protein
MGASRNRKCFRSSAILRQDVISRETGASGTTSTGASANMRRKVLRYRRPMLVRHRAEAHAASAHSIVEDGHMGGYSIRYHARKLARTLARNHAITRALCLHQVQIAGDLSAPRQSGRPPASLQTPEGSSTASALPGDCECATMSAVIWLDIDFFLSAAQFAA